MNFLMEQEDGRSVLVMRTQTDWEESWRAMLTPREGEKVVVENKDDGTFRILCVPLQSDDERYAEVKAADSENALPANLGEMDRADLMTLCAQRGIKTERTDRKGDLVRKLQGEVSG